MGKIVVRGYARKEIENDLTVFTITFSNKDTFSDDAISNVKRNCDLFLSKLKEQGINLKDVHLEEDDIGNYYLTKGKKVYKRVITFTVPSKAKNNNLILDIIKNNKIDANVSTNNKCSNEKKEEIHKELLKEAVLDSKNKAELIASTCNSKLVGVEYLTFDRYDYYNDNTIAGNTLEMDCCSSTPSISDELSNSLDFESEEIFITWNIE